MAAYRFAVLGAGNGGQALAAHLTLLGQDASLYDIDQKKIKQLRERESFTLAGKLSGTVKIPCITDSLQEAVAGRDIIVVTTTTDQHIAIAEELCPLLTEKQIILLFLSSSKKARKAPKASPQNSHTARSIIDYERCPFCLHSSISVSL